MKDEKRPGKALSDLFSSTHTLPVAHNIRAFVELPELWEAAPPRVREGLARRRIEIIEGRCPCGAEPEFPDPDEILLARLKGQRDFVARVVHAPGCAAADPAVDEWLKAGGHDGI